MRGDDKVNARVYCFDVAFVRDIWDPQTKGGNTFVFLGFLEKNLKTLFFF